VANVHCSQISSYDTIEKINFGAVSLAFSVVLKVDFFLGNLTDRGDTFPATDLHLLNKIFVPLDFIIPIRISMSPFCGLIFFDNKKEKLWDQCILKLKLGPLQLLLWFTTLTQCAQ